MDNIKLKKVANEIRKGIITYIFHSQSGYLGGLLSSTEIFTYLFFEEMNIDPKNPKKNDRDRFILSKNNIAPAYYVTLANRGFFKISDLEVLSEKDLYEEKTIPGVDVFPETINQGISIATDIAKDAKINKNDYKIYTFLEDRELKYGKVWEAAMFAEYEKLDNLVVIINNNNSKINRNKKNVYSSHSIEKKFKAFNFHVINIDGHNFNDMKMAFDEAKLIKGKPTVIIAKSIKGKGISFIENQPSWYITSPNSQQYKLALKELNKVGESLCQ